MEKIMDLDTILEMWKKDSQIDEMALDEASRQSANLHSKYLELLSSNRMRKLIQNLQKYFLR